MHTTRIDIKKILVWLAILPVVIVVGIMALSPSGAAAPSALIQAPTAPSSPALKPTSLPVMYEFFTGW